MPDQGTEGLLSPFLRRRRINVVLPHMKGRILDVGCGSGELCQWVEADKYLGFDVDSESLFLAKQKFPDHHFTNCEPPVNQAYDTVVSLAVIEHAADPVSFLKKWARYLHDSDSRFVLTTPHPRIKKIHEAGSQIGLFSRHGSEEHQQLINSGHFQKITMDAGLQLKVFRKFLIGMNQLFILSLP